MKRRQIISITLAELRELVKVRQEMLREDIDILHARAEKLLSKEENGKKPDNITIREIKCLKLALKDELERRRARQISNGASLKLVSGSDVDPVALAMPTVSEISLSAAV